MKAQYIPSSWSIGSWVYFHAFFNKASLIFKLHYWRHFEIISWQSLLWFIMPQIVKNSSKVQGLIEEVWPSWTSLWFHWSQVHISLISQYLEVVLVAMVSPYHPKKLLLTWQKYLYKEVCPNCKGFPRHFVTLNKPNDEERLQVL